MPYSTNLTDAEWETLSPLLNQILPKKKKTRPPNWTQREILNKNLDYFKSKPVNIPKVTILLDHGYHPDYLTVEF
ncbi:MAG: hypothetical protein QQW96_20310 [Tychonema bourrellyi B0820]|uniref:transposase n=1 Tax=Tychonema bourrellyi TaxID=54313 RepID=UPI001FE818FC|nr:transposase [Tychonema bourrellyi]MDQ2099980.1 hypothetical protein [Tychonema bourrellyi B0820]